MGHLKQENCLVSQTIVELENDIYRRNFKLLRFIGVDFHNLPADKQMRKISSINLKQTPRIFIHPSSGVTIRELRNIFRKCCINFHSDLYLYLKGKVVFEQCKFKLISLFIDNQQEEEVSFSNLELLTKDEKDLVQFVNTDDKDAKTQAELRNYMVKNLEKMTRIII